MLGKLQMKKPRVFTLILIILIALGAVCIQPINAQYQGNITINADGSISPSTAPIQQTGNTYSLLSDVTGSILLQRSNSVFNGKEHILQSSHPVSAGINLLDVSNVTVKNLTVMGSWSYTAGISLINSSNVIVANNTISDIYSIQAMNGISFDGIYVNGGNSNVITGNTLVNNMEGMLFLHTSYNLVVGNDIKLTLTRDIHSGTGGIYFGDASNNTIYHNNFWVNIGAQARTFDSSNIWDNGFPSGGNYWSDYQTKYPSASENGSTGIGNTAYVIDERNQDNYPLLTSFNSTLYGIKTTPPKIVVLTPTNQKFNDSAVPLMFTAR